jgi:3-oxoacyl-[acyl-carrier-protein] synthase II
MQVNHVRNMPRQRVVVTGIGVYCSCGKTPEELLQSIKQARCGIGLIECFDTTGMKIKHGGEIKGHNPLNHFTPQEANELDWTGQFAVIAAKQAVGDSRINLAGFAPERVGLIAGINGGRGDVKYATKCPPWETYEVARTYQLTGPFVQTDAVASKLGIHGPRASISTACAASASALGYAYDLFQAQKADVIVAGGADGFSLRIYAGFIPFGAMAPKPCSPFSVSTGVTFGEGAGFVVLEPLDRAQARGAKIYGELLGYGSTNDAYHITTPDPSGDGLRGAMKMALGNTGLHPSQIDYINAHGTGTRDNDLVESLVIEDLFRGLPKVPPVSSSKSFFGHTLGAAGILEFIVTLMCQNEGILPPTINFESPRPGCKLDYVPNQARSGKIRFFLSNSLAFGGVNAVLVGAEVDPNLSLPERRTDGVGITGLGIVSPIGCSIEAFVEGLRRGTCGIDKVEGFDTGACRAKRAGLVKGFDLKQLKLQIDLRRTGPLIEYAVGAAGMALRDAGLEGRRIPDERIGFVMGFTHPSAAATDRFLRTLRERGIDKLGAKDLPAVLFATVSGLVSESFKLKGINSTLVDGFSAGLFALAHGFELLRQNDSQDAMVVVAADEVGALFLRVCDRLGMLATEERNGERLSLYDPRGAGFVLGEGAVAIVLERLEGARARGTKVYATLDGYGLTADASGFLSLEPEGKWLQQAMEIALREGGLSVEDVDVCYGHARGIPPYDLREMSALRRVLKGAKRPVGCVTGNMGVAPAACGLFSVAAAILGMQRGEAYPVVSEGLGKGDLDFVLGGVRKGDYKRALVAGGTMEGNNAAVVVSRAEQPPHLD